METMSDDALEWVVVDPKEKWIWATEMYSKLAKFPKKWHKIDVKQFERFRKWFIGISEEKDKLDRDFVVVICEFQYKLLCCEKLIKASDRSRIREIWMELLSVPLFDVPKLDEEDAEFNVLKDPMYDFALDQMNSGFYECKVPVDEQVWKVSSYTDVLGNLNFNFFEMKNEVEDQAGKSFFGIDSLRKDSFNFSSPSSDSNSSQSEISLLASLLIRDVLGIPLDSNIFRTLKLPLDSLFNGYFGKLFNSTETVKAPELQSDFRIKFIKKLEGFTRDYFLALNMFKNHTGMKDSSLKKMQLSSNFASALLIFFFCKAIQRNGTRPIINLSLLESCSHPDAFCEVIFNQLDSVKDDLLLKFCSHLSPERMAGADMDIFQKFQTEIMKSMFLGILEIFSDSAFWYCIFHNVTRDIFPEFPHSKGGSPRSGNFKEKDIEVDVGSNIVNLLRNLIDISQPSGLAGVLASICNRILNAYAEEIGQNICDELKTPFGSKQMSFVCALIKKLLWKQSNDQHIFITNMSLYNQLRNSQSRRDLHEILVNELTEFIFQQIELSNAQSSKLIGWMKKSVDSIREFLSNLIHIYLELTQSPKLLRFIFLQYIIASA
jgi:hypothetical protein